MSNSYPFGTPVKCAVSFVDENGEAFTPTGDVSISIKKPDATITEYVYGTDAEVVFESGDGYHMWVRPTDQAGTWAYQGKALNGDGDIDAVDEDEFEIEETAFE